MYFGEDNSLSYKSLLRYRSVRIVRARRHQRYKMRSSSFTEIVPMDSKPLVANGPNSVTDDLCIEAVTHRGENRLIYACTFTEENLRNLLKEVGRAADEPGGPVNLSIDAT